VLALAAQFGIPHPVRMGHPFMQLVGCPVITLVSSVTVDGDRRSWVELVVRRRGRDTGGHRCQASDASGATVKRLDRWEASSEERTDHTVWRVHDGDWHVDVAFDSDVFYDSATLIVRAVRRRTLVNQIPVAFRGVFRDTLPDVDASDIRSITKDHREPREYVVETGFVQRYVLYVSIVAGQVLVHSVATWIP
jgi:hypothetical protein